MTFPWGKFFFWLYLFFLVAADATVTNPADPDLWHRLALGEALWTTGHFPPADAFSYLPDYQHIADHEWGSAVLFYLFYVAAGLNIFVAVKIVTLGLTIGFLAAAGLQDRRPSLFLAAYYALVLVALLPSFQSTVRCMTFTHVFFALWLYWYRRERNGRAVPTYLYLITMVIWANLHGGFAIGLAWLFLVAVVEVICGGQWRIWVLRLGLCSLVTLVNPFGWELWRATLRALTTTRQGFAEWAPVSWWPDPLAYPGYKLLLFGVIAALIVQFVRRGWRNLDQRALLLLGAFLVLSLTSARHTSLFAAVAGALMPCLISRDSQGLRDNNPLRRLGLMGLRMTGIIVPLFAAFIFMGQGGFHLEYPAISCPVGAVDFLQHKKTAGPLLVPFNYGSYALWQLRGQMRVSLDGRYDLVYKPATYQRVSDFFLAKGDWPALLTQPPPDAILVRLDDPVYAKLKALPQWHEAWHDPTDAVFLPK